MKVIRSANIKLAWHKIQKNNKIYRTFYTCLHCSGDKRNTIATGNDTEGAISLIIKLRNNIYQSIYIEKQRLENYLGKMCSIIYI